jgi:hypothetical protein
MRGFDEGFLCQVLDFASGPGSFGLVACGFEERGVLRLR